MASLGHNEFMAVQIHRRVFRFEIDFSNNDNLQIPKPLVVN